MEYQDIPLFHVCHEPEPSVSLTDVIRSLVSYFFIVSLRFPLLYPMAILRFSSSCLFASFFCTVVFYFPYAIRLLVRFSVHQLQSTEPDICFRDVDPTYRRCFPNHISAKVWSSLMVTCGVCYFLFAPLYC